MRRKNINKSRDKPICKNKLKERLSILEVSQMYSPKISERGKHPQIICPFHEDHNLGSCRIYTDTNTFKCEACGAHGDTLKLASGYLGIAITDMNELLERLILDFGIDRKSVESDALSGGKATPPPERMSPEEYRELLHDDHYRIPIKFEQIEFEEGVWDYLPVEYQTIYYRTLALKDPKFHDWVICTVSRKYYLNLTHLLFCCQENGYQLMEEVVADMLDRHKILLQKGLVDKRLYRKELRLRNNLLNDALIVRNELPIESAFERPIPA